MKRRTPRAVGSRELKTRLGSYLRQVWQRVRRMVTDRNRLVAEPRPLEPGEGRLEDLLRELVALGALSGDPTGPRPLPPFDPIRSSGGSLADAILEDREDRF